MALTPSRIEYRNSTVCQIDARSNEVKPSDGITIRLQLKGEKLQATSINLTLVDNLAGRV